MAGTSHPVYVFYNDALNGSQVVPVSPMRATRCCSFHRLSYWGCAIALVRDVKRIGSNRMAKLLPVCIPWHCLLCPNMGSWAPPGSFLPDIVAANLNSMRGRTRGEGGPHVDPTEPPTWAIRLMGLTGRAVDARDLPQEDPELDAYLSERNLRGVVVFHDDREQE